VTSVSGKIEVSLSHLILKMFYDQATANTRRNELFSVAIPVIVKDAELSINKQHHATFT
jgi:hypothetical protein